MSWYRKIKSIYSVSLVTISFIIWSTLSKWLFKNPVDYRLFLITLCIVFLAQYFNTLNFKKILVILMPIGLSILASFMFFKGRTILLNTIFLLFILVITYSLEDAPIDHSQYKEDIIKSIVVLVFIWFLSFSLGIEFINEIYKFNFIYIIMIIILMRETRSYVYGVKNNTSMVTNIIIGISVLTLSLDFANKIIAGLLDILRNLASFIMSTIVFVLIKIFGGPIAAITKKLMEIIINRKSTIKNENIIGIGKNLKKPTPAEYESIQLPPVLILVFKILFLLLILYAIYKFLSRFRSKTKIYNEFVEEKVKKKIKKHWVKDLFSKIFEGGKTNRDKILYTYKDFEKITEEANIYKTYMTATQLKNITKINVDNFDNLDAMTQVYNEAKFSLHQMTEEQVERVKKGHSNIKKQL